MSVASDIDPAALDDAELEQTWRSIWAEGHPDRAEILVRDALAVYRQQGDARRVAMALYQLAIVVGNQRDGRDLEEFELALDAQLALDRPDSSVVGHLLIMGSERTEYTAEQRAARLRRGLRIVRTHEEPGTWNMFRSQISAGTQLSDCGAHHEALDILETVIAELESTDDRWPPLRAWSYAAAGRLLDTLHRYAEARQLLERATRWRRAGSDTDEVYLTTDAINLGMLCIRMGDYRVGLRHLQVADAVHENTPIAEHPARLYASTLR